MIIHKWYQKILSQDPNLAFCSVWNPFKKKSSKLGHQFNESTVPRACYQRRSLTAQSTICRWFPFEDQEFSLHCYVNYEGGYRVKLSHPMPCHVLWFLRIRSLYGYPGRIDSICSSFWDLGRPQLAETPSGKWCFNQQKYKYSNGLKVWNTIGHLTNYIQW